MRLKMMLMALLMSILTKRCSQEEPFVLGSQVHQCFYVQDPYDQDRHYVMKTVPRDLFNMGDEVESNLPQSYENEPSGHLMGPSIPKDNGDVLLTRIDVPETIIDVPLDNEKLSRFGVEPTECFCCNSPELDTIEHIFNSESFAKKAWGFFVVSQGIQKDYIPLKYMVMRWWNTVHRNKPVWLFHNALVDMIWLNLIYNIYSAGSSRNLAAAILYSAGNSRNSRNSAVAICYNTVLEILERVELFYNFYRVGNSGKSWCVSSADAQDIGRTMFTYHRETNQRD
ncbi:hypothetical protein H5410_030365 [Solanum commersonii]|uniref:Uncharacterized protein n=1 Tax=Solanum commersonii TaxID=4109 RepID=A0A9J5YE44_SOLCO|nr:hypothetical protein H5410_030365 [Solanum commersonii]